VGEVDIPLMRRYIGTLGHVTHITEITLVHYLPVIIFGNSIYFHGLGFINEIKQGREAVTQADAAPAAMAKVKYPF
jgi:hypothetical protein